MLLKRRFRGIDEISNWNFLFQTKLKYFFFLTSFSTLIIESTLLSSFPEFKQAWSNKRFCFCTGKELYYFFLSLKTDSFIYQSSVHASCEWNIKNFRAQSVWSIQATWIIFFRFPLIPMAQRKAIFFFKQVLKLFCLNFRERQWTIL